MLEKNVKRYPLPKHLPHCCSEAAYSGYFSYDNAIGIEVQVLPAT